ncbi:MAG: (2Fe-2S) ferredoxin domain-containing protein, partial [Clostridia bacterium]|nr:(2Fe-2S) ferredoxin domain-containing protein [Clostridia bacterium]
MVRSHVLICGGTGCTSSNSAVIMEKMQAELEAVGLQDEVNVVLTGCFGLCALGPIMVIYPEGTFYSRVSVDDVAEIVSEHLVKGRPVKRLVYDETLSGDEILSLNETGFYKKQHRVALRNCGVINPEIIDVMEKQLVENNLTDEIKIVQTGCFGLCANGPIVIVYPEGTFYSHVQP